MDVQSLCNEAQLPNTKVNGTVVQYNQRLHHSSMGEFAKFKVHHMHFQTNLPNFEPAKFSRYMASSKLLLLFQGDDAKAFETAAIEDDGRSKTSTNGALSGRILRTVLPGAGVSILTTQGTPLLREKSVQKSSAI